jgi:predicted transcriptional regulator
MVTLSVPIDDERFAALSARAAREGKPVEVLLLLAVDDVLEEEAAFIAAVKGGLDDISAGRVVDGESVFDEVRALLANRQK